MTRRLRFLAALAASCCALLAFAALASAQETLYGADGAQGNDATRLYRLDPSTGAVLQTIGQIGFPVSGLAQDPSTGTLYGATGNSAFEGTLITINKSTGAGTFVGDAGDGTPISDITFTPDGTLFGWLARPEHDLVRIDKATGAGTVVGDSGLTFTEGGGLASDAAGTLFLSTEEDDGPLRTVDRSTGLVTTVVPAMDGTKDLPLGAFAFDAAGTLFGVRIDFNLGFRPTELLTINTSTGALSVRGPSVDKLAAIAFGTLPPAAPAAGPAGPTGQRAAALKKCKKKHKKAVKKKKANGALTQSVKKKLNKKLKKCKKKANKLPV